MYLDERPYEVVPKIEQDVPSAEVVVTVPPPLRFSVIVGDCLTNIRAALDYTMWELAHRFFNVPVDLTNREHRRITSFPLFETSTDQGHRDRFNRLANLGVPAAVINEIQSVQPYMAGQHPMGWLHKLVNADKHQAPRLTIAYAPIFAFQIDEAGTILPIPHWGKERQTKPTAAELEAMQMDHQIALQVTLQDVSMPREPVDRTFEQIIEAAANVIPRFERFFV